MSESYSHIPDNPIEFIRHKAEESGTPKTVASTLQAVDAFARFIGGAEISFDDFNDSLLGAWVSNLLFNGYSVKTTSYYGKRLASLYSKAVAENLAKPSDAFSSLQSKLNAPDSRRFDGTCDPETFQKFQKIARANCPEVSELTLAIDMLLFAVYNGGLTFEEIAAFPKDGYNGSDEEINRIVNRYSNPKSKYLFPLNRSSKSARQQSRTIEVFIGKALSFGRLKPSPIPTNTPLDIWCMLAMACGVSPSDIAACLGSRAGSNAVTAFVTPSDIDQKHISEIRSRVIETVAQNPVHWYAMHLRRHIDFDMLMSRLKERKISLQEIYYPMEEITRLVGKKKVFEERPVISWLMFFRERVTELNRLYHNIGDLAWGYRTSRDVGSPYAIIGNQEIAHYQQSIGTLSPSTEFLTDEQVKFNEGDCLVILGGAFNGQHAIFLSEKEIKEKGSSDKKIVFRVRLSGGKNANWTVDWDPRLVRKISPAEYQSLDLK